ncbi:MAG: hypothetical protein LBR67_04380 [Dysgonamonadaceae bacterium]|jgi:hypothetical protein|nr:hypothetical protein [Dysgonamonadaceae bacterium]
MKQSVCNKIFIGVLFFTLCSRSTHAFSFNDELSDDARSVALGNIRALNGGFGNPAFISFLDAKLASISVHNRFQMEELNTCRMSLLYPNRILDAGMQMSSFGYEDYRITSLGMLLAKRLHPNIALGAKLLYVNRSSFADEQSQSGIYAGIGMRMIVSPTVRVGLTAENLATTFDEKAYSLHAGIDYTVPDICTMLFEASSGLGNPFECSVGVEFNMLDCLCFRTSMRMPVLLPALGASCRFDRMTVSVGFLLHEILGNSSIIEVGYEF